MARGGGRHHPLPVGARRSVRMVTG